MKDRILIHGVDLVPHIRAILQTPRGQDWHASKVWLEKELYLEKVQVFHRKRRMRTHGVAYWHTGRITINEMPGSDAFDSISTLVHEMAHLMAPKEEGHGDVWGSIFRKLCKQTYDADVLAFRLHQIDDGLVKVLRDRHKTGDLRMAG